MTPLRAAFLLLLGCLCVQPAASAQTTGSSPHGPISARIVNGVLTDAYPTTGALVSPANPGNAELVCTGTMIGCRTFLTAAHCVCEGAGVDCPSAALDASDYLVFLQHAGFFPVERVTVHPDYDFPDHDLAVVRLAEPVTGVSPTPLPHATASVGTPGTIVGFGRGGGASDDFGLKRSTRIETATCPIDLAPPLQLCWDFLDPIGQPGEDGNTCNGDSGGPLFVDLGFGPVIGGVTSGGTTVDCMPPDESWDTNVHHFVDYLRAQAGADLDSETCGAVSQVGDAETRVDGFSGQLGPQSPQVAHAFEVPAGTAELRVTLNASEEPGADFDLFVRATGGEANAALECSETGSGQWAACLFDDPVAGPWELVVQRALGAGEYQATATSFAPGTAPPEPGNPQSSTQRHCVKVQGKLGRKVASAEVTNVRNCMKDAARGRTEKLGLDFQTRTAQACLTNDVKDRVGKLARKAAKKDEKECSVEPPDFGYAGPEALAVAPVEELVALVGDLLGADLDTALVADAADPDGAACQQELVRRAGDVYDAAVRTVLSESKSALAGGAATADALATAIGSALLGDVNGKIAKATSKLRSRVAKRCTGASLAALFPGACFDAAGTDALAVCAAERTLCRQCLAEEDARAIELDCDLLDDANANASCG